MNSPGKQTYYTEFFNNFTSSSSVSGSSGWKLSNEPRSCSCWKEENILIFCKSLVWVLVLHGSILFPLPWDLVSMTVFFYLLFISEILAQLLGWTKNSLSRNLVIVIFCSHGRISTSLRQISGYVAVDFQEYSVKQLPQMLLLNGWSRFTLNFIPWYNKIKSIRIQETCYMYDSFTPLLLIWQVTISF